MTNNHKTACDTRLVVLHAVEAFGGGVGYGTTSVCQRMSSHVRSVIVHGMRDFDPTLAAQIPDVELIPWSVGREISKNDLKAMREFRRIIARVEPDVIHLHSSKAGALGRVAMALSGRPVLYTPHSYSFLRRDVSWLKSGFYKFIEYALSHRAVTIACGLEEYEVARKMRGPVILATNAVDFSVFHRDAIPPLPKRPDVVAVGRLVPQKDFEFFRAVARAMPEVSFTWVTGAESPPASADPNLEILGKLSPRQLAGILRGPSVFLNTSLWEGLSKAVLEACAMGMPLVLRDVPGNRELPFMGADAWLFETIEQCVQLLRQHLSLFETARYSQRNVALARRFFSSDGHELETIYHSEGFIKRRLGESRR